MRLTTRRTPNYHASYALVDAFEASSIEEALRRLEARLYGVERIEEEVHGCPCYAPGLSARQRVSEQES